MVGLCRNNRDFGVANGRKSLKNKVSSLYNSIAKIRHKINAQNLAQRKVFDPTFFIAPAGASIGQPPQAALRPAEKVGRVVRDNVP